MRTKRLYIFFPVISILSCLILSCSKFVKVPTPDTQLTSELVFEEEGTAVAAISGLYNKMSPSLNWAGGGSYSVTLFESVYSDEMQIFVSSGSNGSLAPYYFNNVIPTDGIVSSTWSSCYNLIYSSNRIIEGLAISKSISSEAKQQLTGEALFVRAFCHFYLVNLFGDVPYVTSSDYIRNSQISRTSSADVYDGITADLLEAKEFLPDNYVSNYRVRPNKAAAEALLSRVYLYTGQWAMAEEEASNVIGDTKYELLNNLNGVFLKESREAIWQIIPALNAMVTNESSIFILRSTPTNKPAMTDRLFQSFETGDLRKTCWIDTLTVGYSSWHFPYKYKEYGSGGTGAEYSVVMRLAEQYLIRAEARAMQNKLTGENSARSDINAIRNRAGLINTTAATQTELLDAIRKERRSEFFAEWGHRFFDLKRWGKLDVELGPVKQGWSSTDALLPIPQSDILKNGHLTQNPGY
jgi:hypothetical protein